MGKHEIIEDTGAPSEAEGSGAPASEPPASKTSKMALAGAEASEQADLPIEERRDVRRVRQAGDDDVRATCRVSWRRRLARARRRGEFPRASLGAIPDHEWKPGIGNPLRHWLTDGSESEESNVHCETLSVAR